MANLTESAVSIVRAWSEGGVNGKDRVGAVLRLNLTGQGGTTDLVPSTALGFRKVESCGNLFCPSNNHAYLAVPNADGSAVHFYSTLASAPVNVTAAGAVIEVHGYR